MPIWSARPVAICSASLVEVVIIGWLAERGGDRNPIKLYGIMLLGDAVVFVIGLAYLGSVIGWDKPLLSLGFYPFVLGDLVKLALAAALVSAGARLVRR